jgi:hypothetical protein
MRGYLCVAAYVQLPNLGLLAREHRSLGGTVQEKVAQKVER